MLRVVVTGAVALALVGGCMLVTGSTDGYSELDAGCGCEAGNVCCLAADGAAPSCQASCSQPELQLCGSSEECGDGGTCVPQTCTVAGNSYPVSTCATLPGCQPQ